MFFRPLDPPAYKAMITFNGGLIEQTSCILQNRWGLHFQPLFATASLLVDKFEILDQHSERVGYNALSCTLCNGDVLAICGKPWRQTIIVDNRKGKCRTFESFIELKSINRRWARRAYRTLVKYGDRIVGPGTYDFTAEYRYKTFTLKVGVIECSI